MEIKSKGNFINGKWLRSNSGESFNSYSPVNQELLWEGSFSTEEDVKYAVESAKLAFNIWSKLDIEERINYIKKYIEVVEENKEVLAECISNEVGKPYWESLTEVNSIIGKLEPCIEAYNLRNQTIVREQNDGSKSVTRFKPHGVIGIIGPYNFPAHMPNGHIMAALLAGNTVVLKPSEKVPLVSEKVMDFWKEAGLPNGVINMVQGNKTISEYLCLNNDVKGIFFTGSKKAGQNIEELCLHKKICVLEMGGNSPYIVWDTNNIDSAVITIIQSSFITSGQRCSTARRLILPKNKFGDLFLDRLVQVSKKIKVGKPKDEPQVFMGPLKSKELVDNIINKQEELVKRGAKILLESVRLLELGNTFITPGIIDVTNVKEKIDEEIIGPFLQVTRVETFEDAIEKANNSCYGLAAGIITENKNLYKEFENKIQAGIISWNKQLTGASKFAPFGGIKDSGNYRPSGFLAADYCVYSTASTEIEKVQEIKKLPNGIIL